MKTTELGGSALGRAPLIYGPGGVLFALCNQFDENWGDFWRGFWWLISATWLHCATILGGMNGMVPHSCP